MSQLYLSVETFTYIMYNTAKAPERARILVCKKEYILEIKDNGQKVEVIVNHQGEVNGEISVVSVFSNMAKKKKVYLRLLAILLIIGLALPMLLAEIGTKAPDTQAAVMLRFMDTDPETGTIGKDVELVIDAASMGKSITFPKPSYEA